MILESYKKLIVLVGCILLLLVLIVCEKQLPQDLQKEDNYPISDFDAKACHYLTQDTTKTDTVVVGMDTTYVTKKQYVPVTGVHLDLPIANAWINASDSLINALFDTLVSDTTLLINNPSAADTIFALYDQLAGETKQTYFFISWDLNEENVDAYIEIDVFKKDGKKADLITTGIDLETVAGCTQTVEIGGQPVVLPKVRARFVYELPEKQYLVRFYISEPITVGTFRMAILQK